MPEKPNPTTPQATGAPPPSSDESPSTASPGPAPTELIHVDLRQPGVAAFYAWLWPGAGHLYQRRFAKGILFMVCILSTYFFGLTIGDGRVVYASFRPNDTRWQYVCQLGVGAPALPAIVQAMRVKNGEEPLFGGYMAPPKNVRLQDEWDDVSRLNRQLHTFFELGTLYTMIAGLLNVLAIYDAYAGPFVPPPTENSDRPPPEQKKKGKTKSP